MTEEKRLMSDKISRFEVDKETLKIELLEEKTKDIQFIQE